jgi:hypothetical protein
MDRIRVGALTAALVLAVAAPAGAAPMASLTSEHRVPAKYQQDIARVKGGWILSGMFSLGRFDDRIKVVREATKPIPKDLLAQGYNHIGDIDVVGRFVYVPLEQRDFERGTQAMARYSLKTLRFVDSLTVAQHENSFVAVDPETMVAYSFDRFGGQALLRYDVRADWAPLPPLAMSVFVDKVQGADVADGYAWLSTSNPTNELYLVDLVTGEVVDLGSAGHVPGEGEGIDATALRSGTIHTTTVDPKNTPVWLGHFLVSG